MEVGMCDCDSTKQPERPTRRDQPDVRDLARLVHPIVSLTPKDKPDFRALILEFSITTDSVVATATIRTDSIVRRIVVDWGDGKTDVVNTVPGHHVPVGPPQEPLPPGTYRVHHAYAEPEDRKPFDFFVVARVEDAEGVDLRIRKVTLTPRYRVTNFRTSVTLESPCDSIFESSNEFDVTLFVDSAPVKQWRWEPSNNLFPGPLFRLEGSIVSRELTVADPPLDVALQLIERDFHFHETLTVIQSLNALQVSERIERSVTPQGGGSCRVFVQWDRDVRLLVPLPAGPTIDTAIA
jgi:hypothetical protein